MTMNPAREAIPHGDPIALFDAWFAEAAASEPNDANAMALATATPDGAPSVRMVLLKGRGPDGFVFEAGWTHLNLVNLTEHIAPTAEFADVVVRKGADHTLADVSWRKRPRH